ncbi:MAG TPA: transposase DNA-binding-containing protein, partial [Gemmataceae bacterium]
MKTSERSFGETHFATAQLGHKVRNRCLVKIADRIHRHPGGTLPHKLHDPKDYKAMDRLMNRAEVTHAAVLQPHVERTLALLRQADGPMLILHDTTELDYSGLTSIADLGSIGGNLGRGYLCHNSLAFDPQQRQVLGLANQILHCRELVGRKEGVKTKRDRHSRESRLWTRALTAIGPAPAERLWVHVADRGADTFEHLARH